MLASAIACALILTGFGLVWGATSPWATYPPVFLEAQRYVGIASVIAGLVMLVIVHGRDGGHR